MILKHQLFFLIIIALSLNFYALQAQTEFKQTLFNKGYVFRTQLTTEFSFTQGLIMTYNGDYNTLNIPLTVNKKVNQHLTLSTGLQLTTMLNSNNPDLPVNAFSTLDISASLGGEYNFKNNTQSYFSLQPQLHKFDANSFNAPILHTAPLNYNLGIKF
ncbi:hypothetical protein [Psychroserpens sp.]|jgi:predicted porin|uniref:hypothetical protein n=1 Tax=Psychroserpens sp. TaxID=2020870 RepID=UPI0039E608F5